MSNNGESNFGFWIIIIAIGAIILYFWEEVLSYLLEAVVGIFKIIQLLFTEVLYIGLFIGGIYVIAKLYDALKGK
jgi:hypothetical protein